MAEIVVAGSKNSFSFAVVDFTNPVAPTKALVNPMFGGGCMVDASGTLLAVGNANGGQVVLYDISNPASPVQRGSVATVLGGIGAISINGTKVLVGELNGFRVILIDVSNPAIPTILSTHGTTLGGIGSVSLSGSKAVASGPNDDAFVVLDYTNPAMPTQTIFNSGTGGVFFNGSVSVDLDGSKSAAADAGSGDVHIFTIGATATPLGVQTTAQNGVDSISISGSVVAAASSNDTSVSLVDFSTPANPVETDLSVSAALNGGANVKLSGNRLAAGDQLGSKVALYSVAGTNVTLLGSLDTTLGSIATIAFSTFVVAAAQAAISATPASLNFSTTAEGLSTTLPVTLTNIGTANLTVTGLVSTDPHYVPDVTGSFTLTPGGTKVVHVIFKPTAVQAYAASLKMHSNDPAHPTFNVPLSGAGGIPHYVAPATPIDLGSVAVCLSHVVPVTVGNSGTVDLHLTGITASGAGYSVSSGPTLVVPAQGTNHIDVKLAPAATGPLPGSLSFMTDDPNQANPPSLKLTGMGTAEPPPQISVTPSSTVDFGAVPLQYFFGVGVTVANIGPCEPLTGTLQIAGDDFLLTTGDPTTLPMTVASMPLSVPANMSESFTVVYAPTSLAAAATGTLTIMSNDPATPSVVIDLKAVGAPVAPGAVELVLDHSGSMNTPAGVSGTRMDALHNAVGMFADLVIPSAGFAMGSVKFDATAQQLTPLNNFDAAQQQQIKADANALVPNTLTSIGAGMQLGQTELSASALPRKVAIVFTDGYENVPPMIASVEGALIAAGTEIYCVGLGDPAYLSTQALNDLAANSGGKFFQTTDPLVLRKQFIEILADAFRMSMATDPVITLQQGVPVSFPVHITSCEARITFVLLWEDLSAQVQMSVRAPDGTTFNSSSSATNRLVRYVDRPGYRFCQIALPPGPNGSIGPEQLGQWTMQIDPVSIPGGVTRASTNVMVDSALRMTADISAPSVNDPIVINVFVQDHGQPLPNAKIVVRLTAPLSSLAQISTPAILHRALMADTQPIPAPQQILTHTRVTVHQPSFNEREYRLQLPAPKLDGVYHVEVNATGTACGGTFQRYWSASYYIGSGRKRIMADLPPRDINRVKRVIN